jgi:hypothetical protein
LLGILEKRYSQYFTSIQSTLSFSSVTFNSINIDLNKFKESDDSLNDRISSPPSSLTLSSIENDKNSILNFNSQEMHQLKHRELFYSRYTEFNVPISLLRGKLELNLFMPDISSFNDYLYSKCKNKFFYQMTYDPNQKMLSADYRQVRIGNKFQADIPDLLINPKKRYTFNGNFNNYMDALECNFEKAPELSELSLKRYMNKIFNKKIQLNKRISESEKINENKDSIMVCFLKNFLLFISY